ncbi:2'-5' RNA ligase family protein [Haloplanus aerogenes]|uniref:2'-5' RNA ligase family protein n=1 Tax=Haloplanus aerogenes TaxID=660522 RepID=A0A3M0D0H9_9EURY|nr:2'-5' RNA ligase family protein [Haloplanus aerogenes]AZH24074.1 2'-5' RNA ligase family protein [Haloplanus aerogenes]RMB13149.1 2'-5' RNA ligase superfamily protein [Haloplanus aerogenes]
MYSLNVPVPGAVERLAADLHPRLTPFDRVRDRHTLVCKRFEADEGDYDHLRERLRVTLSPTPAFEAQITGIDTFETPTHGPGPVVYLAVESPGLHDLHRRLVDAFGAVHDELEGEAYVPHVTLARGDGRDALADLCTLDIEPITWTVSELHLWSRARRETAWRVSLPR